MVRAGCAELAERYDTPDVTSVLLTGIRWAIDMGQPIYVAEERGSLVGYCAWVHLPETPADMVTGLGTWVAPALRRTGLGTDMRRLAADYWRRNGGRYVIGTVAQGNEAGRESVAAEGFVVTGLEVRLAL